MWRLRAARESWVTLPGVTLELLMRRPTERDVFMSVRDEDDATFLRRVIVGWRGIKEHEIVPGGEGLEPAFEAELCVEWLADQPVLYTAAVQAAYKLIADHRAARDEDEKK